VASFGSLTAAVATAAETARATIAKATLHGTVSFEYCNEINPPLQRA
jgi:hypothetical protein